MSKILVAFTAALFGTLLLGPLVIPLLHRLRFGQWVRADGPARHLKKTGTPTMGGIIFLSGIAAGVLLVVWLAGRQPPLGLQEGLTVLGVMLAFGLIGFVDDFVKVALKRPLGLRAREKLGMQVLISILLAVVAVFVLGRGTDLVIPFSGMLRDGGMAFDYGWWFFLIVCIFVVVGTANAVKPGWPSSWRRLPAGAPVFSPTTGIRHGCLWGIPVPSPLAAGWPLPRWLPAASFFLRWSAGFLWPKRCLSYYRFSPFNCSAGASFA